MSPLAEKATQQIRLGHWSLATWCLGIVIVAYIIVFGGILAWADGLPYVLDGNEVFSSLIHARNWVEFGTAVTYGLADESTGLTQASHPFLHTHQGNMPRLTATLLYLLGIRSPEAQIWLHVLLIGPLIMGAAYAFVLRIGGVLLATSVCLVLIFDYVFFVQWQVNTYRMWGMFFVAVGLMLVEYADDRNLKRSSTFFFILFSLLFYGELVFAAFCSVLLGTYAVLRHYPRWRIILASGFSMAAGACVGVAVLVLQLLDFYGFENLKKDFTYTFLSRNSTPDLGSIPAEVIEFFNRSPIVFFYNVQDQSVLKTFDHFMDSLTSLQAAVYHPLIVLIATITILLFLAQKLSSRLDTVPQVRPVAWTVDASVVLWILSICFLAFELIVNQGLGRYVFVSGPEKYGPIRFAVFTLACAAALFHVKSRSMALILAQEGVHKRLLTSAGFGALAMLCISAGKNLFSSSLAGFWQFDGGPAAQLALGIAGWIVISAMMMLLLLPRAENFLPRLRTSSLIKLGVASALAYSLVFVVSAGYVFSGYLYRGQSFLVFQWAVFFGLAFSILAHAGWHAFGCLRRIRRIGENSNGLRALGDVHRDVGVAVSVGLALTIGTWLVHQANYASVLPPTQFRFVQTILQRPGVHGGSSVTNNYGLPFAYQMENWSYIDQRIGAGRVVWNGSNWEPELRSLGYVWFADRHTNKEYLRPDFFICFMPTGLVNESRRLLGQKSPDCFDMPLVRQAIEAEDAGVELVAAADAAPRRWAILRFNWDKPPAGVTSRIDR